MSKTIKLNRGFDLNLAGKPEKKILEVSQPETFAVKPTDFQGITRPKLLVKEGDNVKAGTPILFDKYAEHIRYCSPISGEIVEIKRGEKRKLLEIKILADKEIEYENYKTHSISDITNLTKKEVIDQLCSGGVWPGIVQRPFGAVADTEVEPKAIFISAFDTHPLSGDIAFQLEGKSQSFQAGLNALKKLTSGEIHLSINGAIESAKMFTSAEGVTINKIIGAHPAGNVGVQIHHIDPINKGDIVWTISPYHVVQIGQLFLEGKYDASKLIAITGSELSETGYVKTYTGAQIEKLLASKLKDPEAKSRFISGNVLTGENIGKEGYIGHFSSQITVIPEGEYEEFLGWLKPSTSKLSFHKALGLLSFLNNKKEYVVDTNTHGEERPFVVSGSFEKVLPMDILPTYLFKAIVANDYDEVESLGIFELLEEDVALCEFIDPSKNELQKLLREGIELIQNS
ncbi:MAG: Na+-transporting NADH:ubiquinone oxidoreductase subunit A [Cyclobacteriaceae bacterium]|jgi:Na+-transporting NADH:ubiquinone oxidoreductase subunit A